MFKNYKIYTNEENEKVLKENSALILEQIIRAYNDCNSPEQFDEFTSAVIGILENSFYYGY